MLMVNTIFSRTVLALLSASWVCITAAAEKDKPTNPFDYNFCGGERVYPIVGVNIATACGPRNQIALGRRGKISWIFPAYGSETERSGSFRLSDEQLDKLSLFAEVVMVSNSQQPERSDVLYKMGVNFSARKPAYVYSSLNNEYTPSNKLLHAMQSLVPDKPKLPDCEESLAFFDPTMRMEDRLQLIESRKKPAKKELAKQ